MTFTYDTLVHLIAGGIGGTVGAIVTCPLEVVKTRLQSSCATFSTIVPLHVVPAASPSASSAVGQASSTRSATISASSPPSSVTSRFVIWRCIRHIVETEGARALFKGLGPNLVGVAPSRGIYFCTYSTVKGICNENYSAPDTAPVHMCSAAAAGFVSSTATNPIWFIKTRLQLDQSKYGSTTAMVAIRNIYREGGIRMFYKGITASYFGITETITHFVIYEFIKNKIRERRLMRLGDDEVDNGFYFFQFMIAGAISKTCASVIAYPHEVARTRLRQQGDKYRKFFQTIAVVWHEEGRRGLYRGLGTQLVRQIPNTAIMMATYELIVYTLKSLQEQESFNRH